MVIITLDLLLLGLPTLYLILAVALNELVWRPERKRQERER